MWSVVRKEREVGAVRALIGNTAGVAFEVNIMNFMSISSEVLAFPIQV